jgi:hypothetical protein
MQMGKRLKIKGSYGGRSQDRTVDLLLVSCHSQLFMSDRR